MPLLPSPLPWWAITLLVSATFFFIVLVVLEFLAHPSRRVYAKSDTHGIRRYMHNWIRHGGRVAIWSRDLTWADDKETRRLLKEKAEQKELILCLPKHNELTEELAKAGAEVCAYGANYRESPASRFTITFFGKSGARVAIGRPDGDTHVVEEFSADAGPVFSLAEDLIAIVRAQCADRQAV